MRPPIPTQWSLRLLLAGAAAVLFTGCVGVTPIPVYSPTPEYGQKVKPWPAAFIQPGQTTRAEVLTRLGTNCAALPRTRSIAYTWEMRGGGGVWWLALFGPGGGGAIGGNWVGGWRGFLVAFDERDIVRAAEFKNLSPRRSLDQNMDRWVANLRPALPPAVVTTSPPATLGLTEAGP